MSDPYVEAANDAVRLRKALERAMLALDETTAERDALRSAAIAACDVLAGLSREPYPTVRRKLIVALAHNREGI